MLSASKYKFERWNKKFPRNVNVKFSELYVESSWKQFFKSINDIKGFEPIEKMLTSEKDDDIFPYPDMLFDAFNMTPLNTIKVVFVGQDPYHSAALYEKRMIPHAMGLSFSVPVGLKIPSSLDNIFKNLLKYKHITKIPTHGNLFSWSAQGCLMLNAGLTVPKGVPSGHSKYWAWFSNQIIKYISDHLKHVVFVLWGDFAAKKLPLIDVDKHEAIITSHPSGLSCTKPLGNYPAFSDYDHFGEINKLVKKFGMRTILWQYDF